MRRGRRDRRVRPRAPSRGALRVPGDKSISHRYALLAAARRRALHHRQLRARRRLRVDAGLPRSARRYRLTNPPARDGDPPRRDHRRPRPARPARAGRAARCGNSGTTMRLLAGVLAAHPFTIDPDRRRLAVAPADAPRHRAARRRWAPASRPPTATARRSIIHGAALTRHHFAPEVPSAQVKRAVLLAGLHAERRHTRSSSRPRPAIIPSGRWPRSARRVDRRRPRPSRSRGGQRLAGRRAARARRPLVGGVPGRGRRRRCPGRTSTIDDVGLNPTRTALLDVLRRAGAEVDARSRRRVARRAGRPRARAPPARCATVVIAPEEVPELIDELPALAALGDLRRQRRRVAAPASCASRRATASPRSSPASARWAPTPRSGPTASTCAATRRLTGGAVRRARAITGWRWRLRSPRSAPRGPTDDRRRRRGGRLVSRLLRRRCDGCAREGRQGLSGRLHGRRQDDASRARSASGSTGGSKTSTSASSARAARHPDDLPRRRRAVLPRRRAPGADRPAAGARRGRRHRRRHVRRSAPTAR